MIAVDFVNGVDLVALTPAEVESSLDFRSSWGGGQSVNESNNLRIRASSGPHFSRDPSSCDTCTSIRPMSVELSSGARSVMLASTGVESSIAARRNPRPSFDEQAASVCTCERVRAHSRVTGIETPKVDALRAVTSVRVFSTAQWRSGLVIVAPTGVKSSFGARRFLG